MQTGNTLRFIILRSIMEINKNKFPFVKFRALNRKRAEIIYFFLSGDIESINNIDVSKGRRRNNKYRLCNSANYLYKYSNNALQIMILKSPIMKWPNNIIIKLTPNIKTDNKAIQ